MAQELKQVPYGETSFVKLREAGYAYVDKTQFIQTLEQCGTRFPFVVRPRRFGKSVFANMLMAYYDKAAKNEFSKNFAGTWIAKHPTPLSSKYFVLKFDFSGIEGGDALIPGFISCIKSGLIDFQSRYFNDNPDLAEILKTQYTAPTLLITDFFNFMLRQREKLYLIIDEYDQFAQNILSEDIETFRSITRGNGFLKSFYAVIKKFTTDLIDKVFITGVTSISLDSLTSGFNVTKNKSASLLFASMFGFTNEELHKLIPQIIDVEKYGHSVDEIFNRMKVLYNGYKFSQDSEETVFNPSMCLYYLSEVAEKNREPTILLDPSFSIDISKIEGILSLGRKEFVDKAVKNILLGKYVEIGELSGAINLNLSEELSDDDVLTALIFMGFLTFSSDAPDHLVCPNIAVKELFFKYWFKRLGRTNSLSFPTTEHRKAMNRLETGDVKPLLQFVSTRLAQCVGIHAHSHLDEMAIQFAVCMAVNTAWNYQVTAEEEALGAGFTDLILRPNKNHPEAAGWVIEFKYLKKSDATKDAVEAKLKEAEEQLLRYSGAENIANIPNLRRAAAVFSGTELKGLKVF